MQVGHIWNFFHISSDYSIYSLNMNQSKSTDYQWNLTDLTVKNIFFTDESVKRQITDSISENLTDSYLESTLFFK